MLNKLGVEGNRFQVNKERKYGTHYLHGDKVMDSLVIVRIMGIGLI